MNFYLFQYNTLSDGSVEVKVYKNTFDSLVFHKVFKDYDEMYKSKVLKKYFK